MEKVQLIHPEGKKAPTMDKAKYDMLREAFLVCLQKLPESSFDALANAVDLHLKKTGQTLHGKPEWNLFWVTLDMESRREIRRNKSVSPMLYTLPHV